MRKKKVSLIVPWSILLIAGTATAYDQTLVPAEICANDTRDIMFGYYGEAANNSTSVWAEVPCALGQDQALDINDTLKVYFDDNNGGTGWGTDVGCTTYSVNADASTVVGVGIFYGCSTPGGCLLPDLNTPYAAEAYISFPNIYHGGGFATHTVCKVPPKCSGCSASAIRTLQIDEM